MKYLVMTLFLFLTTSEAQVMQAPRVERVILTPDNTLTIRGPITGMSMTSAALKLAKLASKRGLKNSTIYIVLDSPGGSIDAGNMFIEFAKLYGNVKTITIDAASMASAIVQSLPGERLIISTGSMMFHRATVQLEGQVEMGEVESRLAFIKSIVLGMERQNAKRMNLDLAKYKALVKDELWVYGEDAVQQNAADRVVEVICSKSLIESKTKEVIGSFLFTAEVEFSDCPLLKYPIQ